MPSNNTNLMKVISLAIFAGVAKAFFAQPKPVTNNYYPEATTETEVNV